MKQKVKQNAISKLFITCGKWINRHSIEQKCYSRPDEWTDNSIWATIRIELPTFECIIVLNQWVDDGGAFFSFFFVLFFLLAVSWTAVDGCFLILWYSKRYLRLAEDTPYTSNDRIKPRRLYLVAITLINKTDEEYIETETSIKFMAHSAEKINPYICICNKKQKNKETKSIDADHWKHDTNSFIHLLVVSITLCSKSLTLFSFIAHTSKHLVFHSKPLTRMPSDLRS